MSTQARSLKGRLRIITPALITWELWKAYSSITFGEGSWCRRLVMELIRRSIYNWSSAQCGKKYTDSDANLVCCGLSPILRTPRCRIVRWMHPLSRRFKMNVDAAHGNISTGVGAILRDSRGKFIGAISFHLPLSTPAEAELQAAYFAFLYFARYWTHRCGGGCSKSLASGTARMFE